MPRPNDLTLNDLTSHFCRAVVNCESRRRRGPATGYRNKMVYTLAPPSLFTTSDIATGPVNAIASSTADFAHRRSAWPCTESRTYHNSAWLETSVKVSRLKHVMIKLTLRVEGIAPAAADAASEGVSPAVIAALDLPSTLAEWIATERDAFVEHIMDAVQAHGCQLSSVVAHVVVGRTAGKPSKQAKADEGCAETTTVDTESYVVVHGDSRVVELTPNGVPFALSADAFSEVNHGMEDLMARDMCDMLRVPLQPADAAPTHLRRFFITGRDVNCVYCTFRHVAHPDSLVVCGCPRANHDAPVNGLPVLVNCPKSDVGDVLRGSLAARCSAAHSWDALVTAGRHGLHDNTTAAFVDLARQDGRCLIDNLIYVSCNVVSMTKDFATLRAGYYVQNFATYDFFPGSNYVMSVTHLRPQRRWCEERGVSLDRRLLVLPVALPGAGKTTVGEVAAQVFQLGIPPSPEALHTPSAPAMDGTGVLLPVTLKQHRPEKSKGRAANKCGSPSTAATIARSMPVVPNVFGLLHWHRDAMFAALRAHGTALNAGRRELHASLMRCLDTFAAPDHSTVANRILFVDSTNGSREARAAYAAAAQLAWPMTDTLVLTWGPRDGASEVLLQRTLNRKDHPAFPCEREAAVTKIANIAMGMEWPDAEGDSSAHVTVVTLHDAEVVQESGLMTAAMFAIFCAMLAAPALVEVIISSHHLSPTATK